ncbi:MAG: polyprenol monophosphomannose synthase [Acidobacteria bacterium]|nr:polyprenol monophosphomannose synthase [Acidobacteriota bacterium]
MLYPSRALVIIPTYNERENLCHLVPAIFAVDPRLHILVIDDASPDRTAEAVCEMQKEGCDTKLFLLSRPGKMGLGSAYIQGFKWGLERKYDFLIQMDADWSHNPGDLARMLRLANEYDFVVGSRYIAGGGTVNWGIWRKLISRSAGIYSRLVLRSGFADFTGGFNGWSDEVLEAIRPEMLRSDGYSFQIELKYRADRLGFTHAEFPIVFTERRSGKSKMSFAIALEACWRVWQFRFKHRNGPRKF